MPVKMQHDIWVLLDTIRVVAVLGNVFLIKSQTGCNN